MDITGDKLRQARRAMRMTQDALGRAIGVSGSAVGKWEAGDSEPSYDHLVKLREVLNGEPAPDSLSQLRDVVEVQARLLQLLIDDAKVRRQDDTELVDQLASLEVVLGRLLRR